MNVYLYQVTPNAAFRNVDLPTRRADGTLVKQPVAALPVLIWPELRTQDAVLYPRARSVVLITMSSDWLFIVIFP